MADGSRHALMEYELTDEEHQKMCNYIQRGFKDSLRRFLEEVTSSHRAANENKKVILSPKTFNPHPSTHRIAPIVMAAMEGRLEILQLFLTIFKDIIDIDHGSYAEYPDLYLFDLQQIKGSKTKGLTALNAACVSGLPDITKVLCVTGANLDKGDHFNYSPLANAARYGRREVVDILLKLGANTNHKTHSGHTAMHLAAIHGQTNVVKLLLDSNIPPLFPDLSKPCNSGVPSPIYLAAERGWQPVVDAFTDDASCPPACRVDAALLLGAAARMFWTVITPDSKKGVVDIWMEARSISDSRKIVGTAVSSGVVYGSRVEISTAKQLKVLMDDPNFEEESLYQCLMIHERCMGSSNTYNWMFMAGMKMYQRKHYKEAECLWQRAMEMHYDIAKQNMGTNQSWQHDLKGSIEYMVQFSSFLEGLVKDGYTPSWAQYIDYALQQLKMAIFTSLQTNLLDSSAGILKLYYCLLQILSCWINVQCGQPTLPVTTGIDVTYPEALARAGQSFVDTASVLTKSNLLHIAIYPAPITHRSAHWQTIKRLPGLLLALLKWGSVTYVNDLDYNGDRPLHVAAKLPNKVLREAIISTLLAFGSYRYSLNKEGKTPEEVFQSHYPTATECPFPREVPSLSCLAANVVVLKHVPFDSKKLPTELNSLIQLHSTISSETITHTWITLPEF